jgi:DNA polymerase-1
MRPRPAQLDAWVAQLQAAGEFAFDTETDSLDPMRANLVGISLRVNPARPATSRSRTTIPGVPRSCRATWCSMRCARCWPDPAKKKLGQHGKYDLHVLRRHGVERRGYADDTMLESFVLNAGIARHDMDSLAQRHLGYDRPSSTRTWPARARSRSVLAQVALDDATRYAAEDADITLRLHRACCAEAGGRAGAAVACTATSRCRWCRCWRGSKPTA